MLSVVLLSVSVAFASDNATDTVTIDEESQFDEPLAVEENTSIVSDGGSAVVTKDNFKEYFDESGELLKNVTANELKFSGEISDVGVDTIILSRPVNVAGDGILNNISIHVNSSNVIISNITINQNNESFAILIDKVSDVEINTAKINFNAVENSNGYAIVANLATNLKLLNNVINYEGATTGWEVNNVIRLYGSNNTRIADNKVIAKLVSSDVGWAEVPAGSGNWVSSPISEGIVLEESDNAIFMNNKINVTYSNVVGSYDTIYAVDFRNSNNAYVADNEIKSVGYTYIYGMIITGEGFIITSNNIASIGDYYANGIDIEGPATGVLNNNTIDVKSNSSVYGIYSGMNGKDTAVQYYNNVITGKAYNVFGMSLGDVESAIYGTQMYLSGNYTTGIAYRGNNLTLEQNHIVFESSQQGNESIWEEFGVESVGVKVIKGYALIKNNTIAGQGKGISLTGKDSDAYLYNNFVNVVANDDKDAYAIYAIDMPGLHMYFNDIDYQGTTKGSGINNAVYLNNVTGAVIAENKFDLDLVSSYVPWKEIPAGSGNWVSFPVSEGIVIENSNNVLFDKNTVNTTYGDVAGTYDTIYTIAFKNSDNAVISNNDIDAKGHTYIYAVQVTGKNFTIKSNNITSESDNYYANGIDIEGPASGVVKDNGISVKGKVSAYGIYSGMNGQSVSALYDGNDIVGDAYNVFGFSVGDVESNITGNDVVLTGNYTTGIAYRGSKLSVDNNLISAKGSNVGNESIWEGFGVQNVGVKVIQGNATISNNNIETTGDYAINVTNTSSTIKPNHLKSAKGTGESAITSTGNATIDVKYKTTLTAPSSVSVLLTQVKSGYTVKIVLKDENGYAIPQTSITVKGKTYTTNAEGVVDYKVTASKTETQTLTINFAGSDDYIASSATTTVKITKEATKLTAAKKTYKVKVKTKKYTATLKDSKGKGIKGVKVTLNVKGKTYKATTNAKGQAVFKIKNLKKKGTCKATVKFAGNNLYKASSKTVKITVKK